MKNRTGRHVRHAVSIMLCIAMVLGMTVSGGAGRTSAAAQEGPKLAGCSLTVGEGALGINLYLAGIPDSKAGQCKVKVDGTFETLSAKQQDGTYMVAHYVDAKDISKKLSIEVYYGSAKEPLTNEGAVNGTVSYAVKDYLQNLRDRTDAIGRLARAIDDYGTCASYYFKGAKEIPVTVADTDLSAYRMVSSGELPECIRYYGSSLVLGDTMAIRHYYLVTDYVDSYTLSVDGVSTEIKPTGTLGLVYWEITGIRAWDIDHAYESVCTSMGCTSRLRYSVLSYACEAAARSSDDSLSKLVRSIYWYKDAFEECRNAGIGNQNMYDGYEEEEITTDYVTYAMFGAKGDGVTDDYDAIVQTHAYANEKNLPVKADAGAVYFIGHMDPSNIKGAQIKTDTDWTGATFVIDDTYLTVASRIENNKVVYYVPEGDCFLFTVEPSVKGGKYWMNISLGWYQDENGKWRYHTTKQEGDQTLYLGLDPDLDSYPDHSLGSGRNYSGAKAAVQKNKDFTKDTVVFGEPGEFKEDALYILKTSSVKRWGRNGSDTASSDSRSQEEIVIINRDGRRDDSTPLQWDWSKIELIQKFPIDQTPLTVKGGTFITKVNKANAHCYIQRGISIDRSNVTLEGVQHYLADEDAQFGTGNESAVYDEDGIFVKHVARVGAPYLGFFRAHNCAYVTLKNCVFSNHLRVYNYGGDTNSTAPYDFYAEYCANITLDGCVCAADKDDKSGPADKTGIMDESRWGTTGTNYCKGITVQNGCSINRIDAHMGTYNLTVKDSTIGYLGILAVGFGDLTIERVTSYAKHFVNLRRDYGSFWMGDITITDCVWKLAEGNYAPRLIFTNYIPNPPHPYGFDPIEEDGTTYYCTMPTNVTLTRFTLDASRVTSDTLYGTSGFQIFTNPIMNLETVVNDAYLHDEEKYTYPLRITKKVTVSDFTLVRNPIHAETVFKGISVKNVDDYHSEYLFRNTVLSWKPDSLKNKVSEPWTFE